MEQAFLDWLENNGQYTLLLIAFLAFAEACVGIGLLISGVFLLAVATASYTTGLAGIELIVIIAFAGALLGDNTGFHVGRWIGPRLHHTGFANRYQANITKTEQMVRKYGGTAIFIGRFIPAIRSLVPAILGVSEFNRLRFLLLDILACILWSMALGAIILGLDFGFFAS